MINDYTELSMDDALRSLGFRLMDLHKEIRLAHENCTDFEDVLGGDCGAVEAVAKTVSRRVPPILAEADAAIRRAKCAVDALSAVVHCGVEISATDDLRRAAHEKVRFTQSLGEDLEAELDANF